MKILVTGANSKIGHSIIESLLADGHEIVTTVTKLSETPAFAANKVKYIECQFERFDYENDAILKAMDEGVDGIVLNACTRIPEYRLFHEHKTDTLYNFLDWNVKPNVRILQRALPSMLEKNFGRIVFISTMSAQMGLSQYSPYILAKTALEGLMRNLAVDYGRHNIFANTLRPGIIRTERNAHLFENPKYYIKLRRIIPSGQVGQPDQLVDMVKVMLARNSYVNGQEINVSGGLPLLGALSRL